MLSEKQMRILSFGETDYDALICDGAIRSGKTSVMMVAYVDWAMKHFDGRNFIIAGKTVKSAQRNVIEPYIGMDYARSRYSLKWSGTDNKLTVTAGKRSNTFYVFGGKDEASYQLVQGFTAAGALIDEVALCVRSFVEQCLARCSVAGSKFWFNCNPDSPLHWFRQEWILRAEAKNAYYLHFALTDNPSLTPEIVERYERMYTGVFYQRYIQGLWVVAEGLVYSCFERSTMVEELEPAPGEVCYISIDYGITNPFAALLWVVRNGVAYCVDEYVFDSRKEGRRLTDAQLYDRLADWAKGRNVESVTIDPSATSFKAEIEQRGLFWLQDADNAVNDGIQLVQRCMTTGALKISPKCTTLLSELGLYSWDEKASEGGRDKVIKENDHACDAMRYFVSTVGPDVIPALYW